LTEKTRDIDHLHKNLGTGMSIYQIKDKLKDRGLKIAILEIKRIAYRNNFKERGYLHDFQSFSQYSNHPKNEYNLVFTKEGEKKIISLCEKNFEKTEHKQVYTTKEVYELLTSRGIEVSISTLKQWALEKNLPRQKIGWSNNLPAPYIWGDEDIKNFIAEYSKAIPEAKKDLTKKYINEGIVIAKTDNFEVVKAQFRAIGNLIESIEKERKVTNQKILENKQEIQQLREEQIEREKFYCVSGEKDVYLRNKLKILIRTRLIKKRLRWNNASARAKEYSNFWEELEKNCGLRRVTNINQREHNLARDFILEKLDDEGIEY